MKFLPVLPLLLAATLIGVHTPAAKSQPTDTLRLDDLVASALKQNPELKFYEAELAATQATSKSAGRLPNPEVSTDIGHKRATGSGLSQEGVAWSVSVMQSFEWPGRLGLRKAIADRDVELAQLGLARFRAALAGRVRLLGLSLAAAHDKATAAREVSARFQTLSDTLVQREPAGIAPRIELRIVEATALTARRAADEAALTENAVRLELNQLRGEPLDTSILLPSATTLAFNALPDTTSLLTIAQTNNFDLRVRTAELAQQGLRVELAKNERYPAIALGPKVSEERAGGDRERIVGVGISLPLPLWNRNRGEIDSARARQLQAEASLSVMQRTLERDLIQLAESYAARRQALTDWTPDVLREFHEAAELADRHYRLGAVPLTTYIESQKQYLEAVSAVLDTRRDAVAAAQAIEQLVGLPVASLIQQEAK